MNADTKALLARLRHYGDNDRDAACALIESLSAQLRAAKIVIEGADRRSVHHGREVGALMQQAADVQGERAANAILTEQVERLEAENAALRRGEFICGRCGLRTDADADGAAPF